MRFIDFYHTFSALGCFDVNQVRMVQPLFDRSALTRWVAKGYLLHLRNGCYAFSDWVSRSGADWVVSSKIYRPSYVSHYSALAHYGMIPEFVSQTTCVTTLKTANFQNVLGTFTYYHVKPELFFGFSGVTTATGHTAYLASPEKALLDLLYLTPAIDSVDDMEQLRLDDDFMNDEFDLAKAREMLATFHNKALTYRFKNLLKAYNLI